MTMANYTKSKLTKKSTRLGVIFTIISLLLLFGPLGYYTVVGLCGGALAIQKVALVGSVITALLLTAICAANRLVFKSKIWLITIGLFCVIDNLLPMIVVFAATQVIDEVIVAPLARHFRAKASHCKDTDKILTERGM